jgi:hypothetical protein
MRLAELQLALHQVDPAAVLVTPQVMDKVIQQVCNLPAVPWDVPHRSSYVVDRQDLFRHIEQEDLNLNPEHLLPTTVILLLRPSTERLVSDSRENILGEYWRRLFHACIHLRLQQLWKDGALTLDEIRHRVEEIGPAEFEEARRVLVEDRFLIHSAGEEMAYIEFAAVFLELRYFAANLLPIYFPSLCGAALEARGPGQGPLLDRVEQVVGRDLDPAALFARTRLPGASDPVPLTDTSSDESHDYYWKLHRWAERAQASGNTVRAAILRTRAARVAPASLTRSTRAEAEADVHRLALRLETALELSKSEAAEWAKDLNSLLDKADQGTRPVEADLLFDLQKVCLDSEQGIYALSLVDWAISLGRRPVKRPLPSQRQVRIIKHLRSAGNRLTMARLSDADRQHLAGLIRSALRQSEERLRVRFRPILEVALQDVGLEPANPPERTAFYKVIEEVMDYIIARGYLTFSDLRDIISRNQLKLPDLNDPQDVLRGDPLLRLDRRLSALLDGVYRPSEIYSRFLERVTALNFGTHAGRLLTTWLTIPFGGAFILIEALHRIVLQHLGVPEMPLPMYLAVWLGLGLYLLGLWHSPQVRSVSQRTASAVLSGLYRVFIDWPLRLTRMAWLRRLVGSWAFQFFYWCLFKPLLICLLIWLWKRDLFSSWTTTALIVVATVAVINSEIGLILSEAFGQALTRLSEVVGVKLFRGLVSLIAYLFKQFMASVEDVLFTVDEWMRFRTGDSRWLMAVRVVLGVVWFPISYLVRFYMVVLIEPCLNPLKFPISTVAGKFILPATWLLASTLHGNLAPFLGYYLSGAIVWSTYILLPDAFGFFFWEVKENWGLYKANRSPVLRPVPIGPHGETMLGLLEPGLHSGTVPKLFARWRQAERDAIKTGNWREARANRHALQELEQTLRLFVMRNLVALVQQSRAWQPGEPAGVWPGLPQWEGEAPAVPGAAGSAGASPSQYGSAGASSSRTAAPAWHAGASSVSPGHTFAGPLGVGRVTLACSRVRVELVHARFPDRPVWLEFEEHEGWLVSFIPQAGWLNDLSPAEVQPLNTALVALYKLAGVGLVREQMNAQLPPASTYEVKAREFVLWLDHRNGRAAIYPWADENGFLRPRRQAGQPPPDAPVLNATQFIFRRVPLYWEQLVECWQKDQDGVEQPRLVSAGVELDLLDLARGRPASRLVPAEPGTNHAIQSAEHVGLAPPPAGAGMQTAVTEAADRS